MGVTVSVTGMSTHICLPSSYDSARNDVLFVLYSNTPR